MVKSDILPIGKIVGVHGITGNVKICSYAESLSVFRPGTVLLARHDKGGDKRYSIKWVKPHSKTALLSLKEIENRTQAEALVGSELFIEKKSLPKLEDDDYYWFDIIGLSVFTVQGEYIGRVSSVMPTGSNDVYIVEDVVGGRQKETLIPALASVVISINLDKKIMQVDLPEGLR
ncbi:MAG: ribosome maturation factor RimM [Thermodesulfobacteriota bacterium]